MAPGTPGANRLPKAPPIEPRMSPSVETGGGFATCGTLADGNVIEKSNRSGIIAGRFAGFATAAPRDFGRTAAIGAEVLLNS
jgi:hypothetical protein